jgi:protein-L-isoaspartate(D-aspartate) O-methyltransferase
MDRQTELKIIRGAYAKQVLGAIGVSNSLLEQAFASVPREDFLGAGPWQILRWGKAYRQTPSDDPVYLYTDDLVGIIPERRINNGQPQLHAHLINQAKPAEGDHIVHIGTGTGYYTAIMAHMVGASGCVTGLEIEPELAARARANFASWPNVQIVEGDGSTVSFDVANVIYVNAGATRPADAWLDRLADGGRLILPLTTNKSFKSFAQPGNSPHEAIQQGAVFRIERSTDAYFAKCISAVAIYPCAGSRDEVSEQALSEALAGGRLQEVTRLYRGSDVPAEDCWLKAPGWSLTYH